MFHLGADLNNPGERVMGKLLVIGSSNRDLIMQVKHLPKPGETVGEGVYHSVNGGKGANQAVAAARAGIDVTFLSAVGRDSFGDEMLEAFKSDGIDTSYILRSAKSPTGTAIIFVENSGENCIGVAPGANYDLLPEHISESKQLFEEANYVLLQMEIPLPTIYAAIDMAKICGCFVILNPAPASKIDNNHLGKVDLLIPNETEAAILSGTKEDGSDSVLPLIEFGIEKVILTQGSSGCTLYSGSDNQHFEALKVEAVDTTAAGDVFCGNLAARLAAGDHLKDAIEFAIAASAIAVTRLGAQPSAPRFTEVRDLLNRKNHRQ